MIGIVFFYFSQIESAGNLPDNRQLWAGEFHQTAPMRWDGPFELYLRYDSDSPPPQPVDGIMTWPSLGNAQVRIEGLRKSGSSIEFKEIECVAGECSQVVVGGEHKVTLMKETVELIGRAKGLMGLTGHYKLIQK